MSGTAPDAAPPLGGVLETGLYVDDLARAAAFYEGVMGLRPMLSDERFIAYPLGGTVLLLFKRGSTLQTVTMPFGSIPPHDGAGRLHFAFAAAEADIPRWRAHLAAHNVAVESEARWPKGGTSLYFRDPDGNLAEIASPGLWANY
ncbi:VOC family protein [Xanthobacter tagetidis]|uniref:Glyoxalase n=1 Tax=Xanthobacter tagetidis TaxID=60216 RepID=A0A3L7ADI8_9HYPH|nr:VOC family protein [Xanthobacter tagetidis]MBB6305933.1 catechol 2,3-dioxygenase-like lactoylglutathione lyase family enzyme [Xanthobacter tagetidis]RLP78453.1 glyoxalase [Xanthobacter tagetidis]